MSTTYSSRRALGTPAYNDASWNTVLDTNRTLLDSLNAIGDGAVVTTEHPSASLNVKISGCTFKSSSGAKVTYAGESSVAMSPSTTNYIYLTDAGVRTVNTTGFPATFHVPLATVVTGTTTITTINDAEVHLMACGAVLVTSTALAMVASGASHQAGFVPDPGSTAGTTRFLREDASWVDPAIFTGSNATVAAGTGAGTTPTVSATGNERSGVLNITTGTTPAASATVATITFSTAFAAAPKAVLLFPANANAAALTGGAAVYVSAIAAANFTLSVGSTGLAASTAYQWYFVVLG